MAEFVDTNFQMWLATIFQSSLISFNASKWTSYFIIDIPGIDKILLMKRAEA